MRVPFHLLSGLANFLGHRPEDAVTAADLMRQIQKIERDIAIMSQTMQDAIDTLTADVAAQTTVTASVQTFIAGLSSQLTAALAAATAAGATPAQLAELTSLDTSIKANSAALTVASTANTPAA